MFAILNQRKRKRIVKYLSDSEEDLICKEKITYLPHNLLDICLSKIVSLNRPVIKESLKRLNVYRDNDVKKFTLKVGYRDLFINNRSEWMSSHRLSRADLIHKDFRSYPNPIIYWCTLEPITSVDISK
jgi:hypothetical protein